MSDDEALRVHVMKGKGTEPPFSGKLLHNKEKGLYLCSECGSILFSSGAKFDSGCGWPSFDAPVSPEAVGTKTDFSHFMMRTEVVCPNCKSHLGHVFDDGPTATGRRYCMNSVALRFRPTE